MLEPRFFLGDPRPAPDGDIVQFPLQNSHAYLYAHILPNSLALRLNVLRRSLEILKERPTWISDAEGRDTLERTASHAALSLLRPLHLDIRHLIQVMDSDSHSAELALTLHDLLLVSESPDVRSSEPEHTMHQRLLAALASPFVETSNTTALLAGPRLGNRPMHILLAKHSSPQAVFSVDESWNIKLCNETACLMFGVPKAEMRRTSLIDLVAPQFRPFVTERLQKRGTMLFLGEIVAIRQPESEAYTSLWAKRSGDLIICMFEQVPCDAFEVEVGQAINPKAGQNNPKAGHAGQESQAGQTREKLRGHKIKIKETAGDLISGHGRIHSLERLSPSLFKDFEESRVNSTRYYTLQLSQNVPCAVSCEGHTLKIHCMPYMAGMFVLDYPLCNVLSCNKAIAKNLFGRGSSELVDLSVDAIIPGFSQILQAGIDDQDDYVELVPGLVLPEHFFRKYHGLRKGDLGSLYTSTGIDGLHRDGNLLTIDVQLRVVQRNVLVLWVTYSRRSKRVTGELQLSPRARPRIKSSVSFRLFEVPSQLNLFPKNEADLEEHSTFVARHSSTRRPKKANTFSVPLTMMSSLAKTSRSVSERVPSSRSSRTTPLFDAGLELDSDTTQEERISEGEMLQMENAMLEKKAAVSALWPTTIGAKKRAKKFSEFDVVKELGDGAYGKVMLVQHKEDPEYRIIIKCIDKQKILVHTWVRDRQLGTIPLEIQIMATLNNDPHPNIMRILDYFEDTSYYHLETPIFGDPPAIDLFDYIEIKKDMPDLECKFIFKQIVLAVYHLHKHGIVHRDIKDENIIVNEHGFIKLIDFGSAGYVSLGPFDVFVGTIDYASPEVLNGEKYEGKPQDVWALGILLYTMIYKENPFYNVDEIMDGDLRFPYVLSDFSAKLIRKVLQRDVDARPTITDIADDPWLDVL